MIWNYMSRSCLALFAAMTWAQQPVPNPKPIPNPPPVPNMLPIPNMEPVPNMQPVSSAEPGSNVKRDADTRPKRPAGTPQQCRSSADQIRNDYDNAKTEDEKRILRRELADLAERCGGWNKLGGGSPPNLISGPTNTGSGSGNSGGGGGGGGGGGSSTPPPTRPIGGHEVDILMLAPRHETTAPPYPRGLPTMLSRDKKAQQHLTNAWRRVSQAPTPRQDSDAEAVITTPTVPEFADTSDIARNGLAAVAQTEREAAALNAYALTRARYLGAQQSGNQAAMARQSELMTKFINTASDAAYAAAQSRSVADQLILDELEEQQGSAAKSGGWSQALPKLGSVSASDLPPEVQLEMQSSGTATQGIPLLLRDLNFLKASEIDRGIAALRARVLADSAGNGPKPPDLANLERERLRANALASGTPAPAQPK